MTVSFVWAFQTHQREVGAAARPTSSAAPTSRTCFKPHQRGSGCCSPSPRVHQDRRALHVSNPISGEVGAAAEYTAQIAYLARFEFQTHQRGGGCCSSRGEQPHLVSIRVSNPISGEVGAAARKVQVNSLHGGARFQTPSAGRWVLQRHRQQARGCELREVANPISGEVGAAAASGSDSVRSFRRCFKPHQRGGGCCSVVCVKFRGNLFQFQTPSAGRWVLQRRVNEP